MKPILFHYRSRKLHADDIVFTVETEVTFHAEIPKDETGYRLMASKKNLCDKTFF